MTNTTDTLFDTPLTQRVLAARAAAATAPVSVLPEERVITIPWPAAIAALLTIAALLFGAGFVAARLTTHAAPVAHTVSCQVAGGPACTRDSVLDPAGTN